MYFRYDGDTPIGLEFDGVKYYYVVRKIPFIGKLIASKIPVNKLIKTIAGAASSSTINWILKKVASNIDVVLSIGGAIAGILDIAFDKKLNNSIWVI